MNPQNNEHDRSSAFSVHLPATHENGCYEIRLESIGGLGANLCGKLLGELGAVYLGLNASAFSSYGSEKRGSPVKSHVRYAMPPREILHNSPVERPHLLVLFHHALAQALPVTAGVEADATVVVNTPLSPEDARESLRLCGGTVCTVDALAIAMECKSRVNMILLGAIARATGFLPLDAVEALVTDTLGKKYPGMLESNLVGVRRGYEEVSSRYFAPDGRYEYLPYEEVRGKWGYDNAPIGGVNPHFGNTVKNDLSPSRMGYIPLFLQEKCIHCGLCDSTCPDMVFQFTPGELRGKPAMLNRGLCYHHCKGCLRCVNVCPVEALVAGKEQEHPNPQWFVRNKDLIVDSLDYEPAGADPWVTGEAYLDEKRVDGGLV